MLLPGQGFFHGARQIVHRIRHHQLACFGQCPRELHLMIVHMLSVSRAARHDHGNLPGLDGMHDGPGTGVHDQQIRVVDMPDKFIHAKKRHWPANAITEWRMSMLDNNRLGKPGRETIDPLQEARERLQRVAK